MTQALGAVDGADDDVVPRRAVQVDDDGVEAERLGDDVADRLQRARQVVGALDEARVVEQADEAGERGERARAAAPSDFPAEAARAAASSGRASASSSSASSASTTAGSNWLPAHATSSARAWASGSARRYGRSVVIAS